MNNKFIPMAVLVSITVLLVGCANPYTQFYKSSIGGQPVSNLEGYQPCNTPVQIVATADMKGGVDELIRQGFVVVGSSQFNAAADALSERNVLAQAQLVNACKVLISSAFSHSVSGAVPLIIPNNSTSYTTGRATAYGSGGYANAYGSSTTTTYGSQTVMMPFTVQRYDANAVYLVKMQLRFGVRFSPIPQALAQRIGRNGGILLEVVVRGSVAYQADIFEGDVIMAVDGVALNAENNMELFNSLLAQKSRQIVNIELWRNGEWMTKSVQLLM